MFMDTYKFELVHGAVYRVEGKVCLFGDELYSKLFVISIFPENAST